MYQRIACLEQYMFVLRAHIVLFDIEIVIYGDVIGCTGMGRTEGVG